MNFFRYLTLIGGLVFVLPPSFTTESTILPERNPVDSLDRDRNDKLLLDSILQQGLDSEALYTLLAPIKPMSSVVSFSFSPANPDSTKRLESDILTDDSVVQHLERLEQIQRVLNKLDLPDLKFVLVPYRSGYTKNRGIQVNVIRVSALDSLLATKKSFFGQFGLVPGADPAVVLAVNEYEKRYERLRGYGYLFGYPDYAVDFFVTAAFHADSTGILVERGFFQIPTFSRDEGHFVYAYPKDYSPTSLDSALYRRAREVLDQYKSLRPHYLRKDSSLRALQLLKDHLNRS